MTYMFRINEIQLNPAAMNNVKFRKLTTVCSYTQLKNESPKVVTIVVTSAINVYTRFRSCASNHLDIIDIVKEF